MTPFKAYLCNIPSEDKFLMTGALEIQNIAGRDLLIKVEISQLDLLENGVISFVVNNIATREDNSFGIWESFDFNNILNFNYFNSVIIEMEGNNIFDEGHTKIYHILNVIYIGSGNIKIICEPSIYNNFGDNVDSFFETFDQYSPDSYKTSFIEWGYRNNSIYRHDNYGNLNLVNFDENMSTDLYAEPPFDINIDLLKWQSNRIKFYQNSDNDFNNFLNNCLWEVVFVQGGKSTEFAPNIKTPFSFRQLNGGEYIQMPYAIFVAPIINNSVESRKIKFNYTPDPTLDFKCSLSAFKQDYSSYILSYQILPYMDMLALLKGTDFTFDNVENAFVFNITHAGLEDGTKDIPLFSWQGTGISQDDGAEKILYNGFFFIKNIKSEPLISEDFTLQNLIIGGYPDIQRTYDVDSIDRNILPTINNPYISLNTTKLTLAFNDGQKYDFDPLLLGYFNKLTFKLFVSLDPSITQTYITLDTTDLEDSPYARVSNLEQIYEKNYFGLNINFDNNMLYSDSQYNQFMAQNKNFYNAKLTDYSYKFGGAILKGLKDVGEFAMTGGTSTSITENNWTKRVSGPRNRLIKKTTFSQTTKTTAEHGMNPNYLMEGGNDVVQTSLGVLNDMKQTTYQLENYANAPAQMLGGNTNIILENNILPIGFYLQIWSASDLTKKSLLETFLDKGIYINRFVDNLEIIDFIQYEYGIYSFDKKYKYLKARIEFEIFDDLYAIEKLKVSIENGIRLCYFHYDDIERLQNILAKNIFNNNGKKYYRIITNADTYILQTYSEKTFGD